MCHMILIKRESNDQSFYRQENLKIYKTCPDCKQKFLGRPTDISCPKCSLKIKVKKKTRKSKL